uniref:Uncharacterized protein n=1 Tax=Tanacetum cinerariifolium TaxID=118510 RepID=A0A6L2J776_TANCI|nr:hypothetical protein [Tanacetum cinerariifolium]
MNQGRQVALVDYFINNDLEYLRGGSSSKKYTTSHNKNKPTSMIFQALKTWFYRYGVRNQRIIASNRVSKYDYGYLEENEVLREDQQLYKFKEGVESYQKKLNITKPETFRLMRSDELYNFSSRTLTSVRTVLHDIASNLRMDYSKKME